MEMNVTSFHQEMEESENESIESVVLPFSSQTDKIFAPPQVLPRIGEQYQAVIPSLIIECKSKSLEAGMNLPKFVSEYSQISHRTENLELRVEHMNFQSESMMCVGSGAKDIDSCLSEESRAKIGEVDKDLCLLHYGESWKERDCQSFVLGLYIFEKKFTLLQRFVQTKTMGDILSYYYGTFYSSDGYRRWSRGRKLSNRWCIKGQKIFTGWRQQELICRLSSQVSIEIQNRLLQLSQTYSEGKMSFEDYVFTLTNLVGMDILVEAIGIGKGKKDLTRKAMQSKKANHVISVHPELSTGKACSLLTALDIIKILTGDFRLSKTRCNDLFWEAVWPRLLARGWHSEQPNKHVLFGSREPLIFFLPGVGKFSKCELLKGSHYFDSVSDVLQKVASEPELLESEINELNENLVDPHVNPNIDDDMPIEKLKCYLQPHCRSGDLDQLKFPVVDTSMAEGARFKFRGLRCLPAQTIRISHFSRDSGETEGDTTEKSEVKGQDGSISKPLENLTGNKVSLDDSCCTSTVLNATTLSPVSDIENQKAQSKRWLTERKAEKYQFDRKIGTRSLKNLASLMNEWDQNGDFHREQQTSDAEHVSSNETNLLSLFPGVIPELGFRKNTKSSTPSTSSAIACRIENDVNVSESFQGKVVSPENHQSMNLIDLNLSPVDTDSATDELLMVQSKLCEKNLLFLPESKQPCPSSSKISNGILGTENNQRPMRNRPLTTKALEAFEHEFFNEKRKRKNGTQHNNVKRKHFRQAQTKNGKRETFKNGSGGQTRVVDFKVEENSLWPPVTPILAHTFGRLRCKVKHSDS